MRDGDAGRARGGRDGAPARVAPVRMRLFAFEVEWLLRALYVQTGRAEQCDTRFVQALLEWRPYRVLLAGERTAPFVERTKASRQELEAVYQHCLSEVHERHDFMTRQVVVPCARSLPVLSAISLPSAVATRPPRCRTFPSQRTRPVSSVMGRTKLTLVSRLV